MRHQYALGIICGAAFALAASAALVSSGLVDTADLRVERAQEIRAWDTHGSQDRSRWTRIDSTTHLLDSVRHLYATNGAVAMTYAGSRSTPFAFRVSILNAATPSRTRLPRLLPPAGGADPGRATVELPSNQEMVVRFSTRGLKVRAALRAGTYGYRLAVRGRPTPASEQASIELPIAAFVPPFAVVDGTSVQTSATVRASATSISMTPGRGYALRLTGSRLLPFLMTGKPANLELRPDRLGFATVASVRGAASQLDVFVGLLNTQLRGPGFAVRGASSRSRSTRAASFVDALLTRGEWSLRSIDLRRGALVPSLPAGATMRTLIPLTGTPSSFADVTEQALVALGS